MKSVANFTAAAALLLGSTAAAAAPSDAPVAKPLTKDQQEHAIEDFRLIASAMASDKVDGEVKSVLMGCIYSNSLGKISQAVDTAIAANADKVDRSKPDEVLGVIVGVCGYRPQGAGESAPATPKGR